MRPFYAGFGYHPGNNYPAVEVVSDVPPAEEFILKLKKLREDMRDTLILARQGMAKFYNCYRDTHDACSSKGILTAN